TRRWSGSRLTWERSPRSPSSYSSSASRPWASTPRAGGIASTGRSEPLAARRLHHDPVDCPGSGFVPAFGTGAEPSSIATGSTPMPESSRLRPAAAVLFGGGLVLALAVTSAARAADMPKLAGNWTWSWNDAAGETHRHILEIEGLGEKLAARE